MLGYLHYIFVYSFCCKLLLNSHGCCGRLWVHFCAVYLVTVFVCGLLYYVSYLFRQSCTGMFDHVLIKLNCFVHLCLHQVQRSKRIQLMLQLYPEFTTSFCRNIITCLIEGSNFSIHLNLNHISLQFQFEGSLCLLGAVLVPLSMISLLSIIHLCIYLIW